MKELLSNKNIIAAFFYIVKTMIVIALSMMSNVAYADDRMGSFVFYCILMFFLIFSMVGSLDVTIEKEE